MKQDDQTETLTEEGIKEKPKIQSIWLKPTTWAKFVALKTGWNLTWGETLEVILEHMIQSNSVPKETVEEIRKLEAAKGTEIPESPVWREAFGIGGSWATSAGLLEQVKTEHIRLNNLLEELVSTIEDHADAVVMQDGNGE